MARRARTNKATITLAEIDRRKFELFKRDPLALEMDALARRYGEGLSAQETERIVERLEDLERLLQVKWHCALVPAIKNLPLPAEPLSWLELHSGHSPVTDLRVYIKERIMSRLNGRTPDEEERLRTFGWIFFPWIGGYEPGNTPLAYVPIPQGCLPLLIDVRGITDKNRSDLCDMIWAIIGPEIEKRQMEHPCHEPASQVGDCIEVAFLLNMPAAAFDERLRWYDLHVENGMSPRLIRLYENAHRDNAQAAENWLKRQPRGTKKWREWKCSVHGEDIVEKGIKEIFRAIHRSDCFFSRRPADMGSGVIRQTLDSEDLPSEYPGKRCITCKRRPRCKTPCNKVLEYVDVHRVPENFLFAMDHASGCQGPSVEERAAEQELLNIIQEIIGRRAPSSEVLLDEITTNERSRLQNDPRLRSYFIS